MDDISDTTSHTDETAETGSLISNPSSFSVDIAIPLTDEIPEADFISNSSSFSIEDPSIAIPLTDDIPETDFISNPSSVPMDDLSTTISPTDAIPETSSFIYNPGFAYSGTTIASYKTENTIHSRKNRYNALPRNQYTDIPRISSSPTDEIPETDSFIYNPSFAYSGTTIASYKTENTIHSRKSRYNALPGSKYADIPKVPFIGHWYMNNYTIVIFQAVSGLRQVESIDLTPRVDAGLSQAAVQNVILIDSGANEDVRSTIMSFDPFRQTFIYMRSPGFPPVPAVA